MDVIKEVLGQHFGLEEPEPGVAFYSIPIFEEDLEKFKYSLIGDEYSLDEVEELSEVQLMTILSKQVKEYIDSKYIEFKVRTLS